MELFQGILFIFFLISVSIVLFYGFTLNRIDAERLFFKFFWITVVLYFIIFSQIYDVKVLFFYFLFLVVFLVSNTSNIRCMAESKDSFEFFIWTIISFLINYLFVYFFIFNHSVYFLPISSYDSWGIFAIAFLYLFYFVLFNFLVMLFFEYFYLLFESIFLLLTPSMAKFYKSYLSAIFNKIFFFFNKIVNMLYSYILFPIYKYILLKIFFSFKKLLNLIYVFFIKIWNIILFFYRIGLLCIRYIMKFTYFFSDFSRVNFIWVVIFIIPALIEFSNETDNIIFYVTGWYHDIRMHQVWGQEYELPIILISLQLWVIYFFVYVYLYKFAYRILKNNSEALFWTIIITFYCSYELPRYLHDGGYCLDYYDLLTIALIDSLFLSNFFIFYNIRNYTYNLYNLYKKLPVYLFSKFSTIKILSHKFISWAPIFKKGSYFNLYKNFKNKWPFSK